MSMRILKGFMPALVFRCGAIIVVLATICYGQVKDVDQVACKKAKGIWIKATQGIPGDGTSHVKIVATGPDGYEVVGGHASGLRQNLDNEWTFSCLMNPAQPPTVANSEERRCTPPGNDMSVEQCSTNGSAVTCEYVNQKNAPSKLVELGACFKE
jgi:hypothetical protein